MSSVDDRIVNMKFNNSQFGQGVDKSKRDLTGLEKTIANTGRGKGMTTLGSSVQQVSTKFSALQIAGTAALATIAAKATSVGLSMLKKFTIQPLIDGFKEYQTGLESVQTIMSNTGRPVKEVNAALLQLNNYADKTIYNFGQMAKNVGTFTAAGVDLKTSVASIKGIANLAALSGSNSQQAATAMYQLSQAISAGKVGLQDWNSVVNAGMGGKIFQTALTRTAMNMGTLNKGAVTLEGQLKRLTVNGESFRTSIMASPGTESYLTGDVLVETLKQISGGYTTAELMSKGYSKQAAKDIDKLARDAFNAATQIKTLPQLLGVVQESIGSTFAQGFSLILGDFEQSKELWTNVAYDIIGPHGFITRIQDSFIGMLKGWSESGGRDKVLAGFGRLFKGLGRIAGAFRDAFTEIFPPTTGDQLYRLSKAFKQFALNFRTSKETAADLKNIFKGFFSILHIGISIVTAIASGFAAFFGALFDGSEEGRGGILSLLGSVGQAITAFDKFLTGGGKLSDFMSKLGATVGGAIAPILQVVGLIVSAIAALVSGDGLSAIAAPIDSLTDLFLGFIEGILGGLTRVTAPFENISTMFDNLRSKVAGMSGAFVSVFSSLGGASGSAASGGLSGIVSMFDSVVAGAQRLGDAVSNSFNGFMTALDNVAAASGNVTDRISGSFDTVGDAAGDVKNKTKGMYDSVAGGSAAAASATIDGVAGTAEKAGGVFDSVVGILKDLGGKVKEGIDFIADSLSNIPFPDSALDWGLVLNALISGAIIKKLFFSKGLFASLKDTITDVGDSVVASFGQLTDTLKTMQNSIKAEMLKNIAISVGILVASLLVLSLIPMEKLGAGLGALATVMSLMGGMLFALGKLDSKINVVMLAGALVLMSTSILIMAAAIAVLGNLDYETLAKGLAVMGYMLALLLGTLLGMSKLDGSIEGMAASMLIMAIALNVLAIAIATLGNMDYETLAKGLTAMALALAIMVGALFAMSKFEGSFLKMAATMVIMAVALNMLVFAIAALGVLPYEVLAKGLTTIALVLAVLVAAMLGFSLIKGSIEGMAVAMVVIATAITILAAAIAFLGVLPYEVLAKGLVVVALALGILLAAAFAAQFVTVGLAALSTVFTALGLALLAAGTGIFLMATGLAILAAVGAAAIVVITSAIVAFIALLPSIAASVAAAFVSFIETIAEASPRIRRAFDKIIDNMLQSAQNSMPKIAELIREALTLTIEILVSFFPAFYEAMWRLLDGLLDSIADHLPDVIDSAYEIAYAIIDGMGKRAVDLANAGADALVELLEGLADAVRTKGPLIRAAMVDLAHALADELQAAWDDFTPNLSLPEINLPDRPGWLGGDGRMKLDPNDINNAYSAKKEDPLVSVLRETGLTVAQAIEGAVKLMVGAMSGPLYDLAMGAKGLQSKATYQATIATSYDSSAAIAEESAQARLDDAEGMKGKAQINKKGKGTNKKGKRVVAAQQAVKAAAKQRKAADEQARKAALDQIAADFEARKVQDAIQYKNDPAGLGDAKSQQGQELADRSADLLASAQAKAAEIQRLDALAAKGGKSAVKYRQQAAQLRKEAAQETAESMALATQSIQAQEAAVAAYAAARKAAALDAIQRMADIRAQRAEEDKQRAWQKKYDEAESDAVRAQMLEERKTANEKIAADATWELNRQLAIGDALAAKIAGGGAVTAEDLAAAEKAAIEAERQAAIANAAMDAVEQDKQAIIQLNNQTASNNTNGTSTITPSKTALEDAAREVDRYTASVRQAEQMEGATSSTTQFVQNNYSPESLSASTIYRQGKNLVAAADFKMGDN